MFEKYLMLAVYFVILMGLSIVAARRVKNLKDYFTANKTLGYWVAAFSTQATGESAWLLLGLTGMGAMAGVSAYWVVVGELFGVYCAWFLMAGRFKKLTDRYDSLTVTDYLVSRFRAKTNLLRIIASLSLTVFVLIYISAQIDATGSAFERFMGWDYHMGAIVGFVIVVAYCTIGGFLAVAWTDMFQGAMMLLCLVMLPLVAYFSFTNFDQLASGLAAIDPGLISIWGGGDFGLMTLMTLLGMVTIGLGYLGSPQIFARYIAIRDENEISKGRWVAVSFTLLTDTAAVSIGILGRYLFTEAGADPTEALGNGAQNVLPELVEYVFPALIVGLYVAAVLSAIMSTVSSLLILAAGSVTHDFYQTIFNPSLHGKKAARVSRMVTVGLAVVALSIAATVSLISPDRTIFWFVIFGWSGIAATFCPMMILSLTWRGYTAAGAITSMIIGFLSIPFFKFIVQNIDGIGDYFTALEALPPAFALSMLTGYVVSKVTPDADLVEEVKKDFNATEALETKRQDAVVETGE